MMSSKAAATTRVSFGVLARTASGSAAAPSSAPAWRRFNINGFMLGSLKSHSSRGQRAIGARHSGYSNSRKALEDGFRVGLHLRIGDEAELQAPGVRQDRHAHAEIARFWHS